MQFNLQYSHSSRILKALLLILSLVICSITSIYASDSDITLEDSSAIGGSSSKVIGDNDVIKAATSDTIVVPSQSYGIQYYYNSNSNTITNLGSIGYNIRTWGDMVSAITQAFAYSAKSISSSSGTTFTWPSLNYTYSPTTSDNGVNVNFSVGSSVGLQAINNQLSEMFRENWRYQFRMFKYFMPSVDQLNDDWIGTFYRRRLGVNGTYESTSVSSPSIMFEFDKYMKDSLFNQATLARRIIMGVVESSSTNEPWNKLYSINNGNEIANPSSSLWADIRYINRYLTHLDTNLIRTPSGANYYLYDKDHNQTSISPSSMYDYMRRIGNNLSDNISRLAYVLANDDDIALRQQNADNVTSFKNNLSGNNGLSPTKIVNAKNIGSDITSGMSSNASISDGTAILSGDSNAWAWFTSDTANALDSVSNMRKSENIEYYYLTQYENELNRYVGKSSRSDN